MKPLVFAGIAAMAMFAAAGCNRAKTANLNGSSVRSADGNLVNPKITIARGCLTGDAGQFVLTNLDRAAPAPGADKPDSAAQPIATTDSYRLIGMDDRLRGLVGQRVEVTGDSQSDGIVDLVSATPAVPPKAEPTGTAGSEAVVSTASRARVEIHDLRVSSVSPLGDNCPGR